MFTMALRLFSIIFLTTALVGVTGMPGGLSWPQKPNPRVQAMITSVKPQVEKELGHKVPKLTLLLFGYQVVNGFNYFCKVDIGEKDVAHLKVFHDVHDKVHLRGVQYPKGRHDVIKYF